MFQQHQPPSPSFPTALTFAKIFSFWPLWFSPGNLGLGADLSLLLDLKNGLGQSFGAGEVIMKASNSGRTTASQSVTWGVSACMIFEGSELSLFGCPVCFTCGLSSFSWVDAAIRHRWCLLRSSGEPVFPGCCCSALSVASQCLLGAGREMEQVPQAFSFGHGEWNCKFGLCKWRQYDFYGI